MPGMVLQVMVESGQQIKKGDAIVVLEAMKMENILKSPSDGVVKTVKVIKGDKVEKNQVMVFWIKYVISCNKIIILLFLPFS